MARSRGFTRQGPQRRKTSWEIGAQTGIDGATRAVSSSSSLLAVSGVNSEVDGLTLIRTRGDLNLFLTTCDAVGNGFHGAFGIGIVNENAFAAGIGSVLTPLTDEDWDGWFYHRYFGIFSGGPIAAATAAQEALQINSTSAALHVEVDSKAMRKLTEQMTIYAALEVVELGTCTMEWAFNSRSLFKLP